MDPTKGERCEVHDVPLSRKRVFRFSGGCADPIGAYFEIARELPHARPWNCAVVADEYHTEPDDILVCDICDSEVPARIAAWRKRMQEFAEDEDDRVLKLDDAGPNALAVAAAIRPLTGLTSEQALAFIRSGKGDIARRNHHRIWELQQLQQRLEELGAKTTIVRC